MHTLKPFTDDIANLAAQFGLSPQLANDFAIAIEDKLRHHLGGEYRYIPKNKKKDRNQWIRQSFNGTNHEQICKEYGISKRTLYRVLNQKQ